MKRTRFTGFSDLKGEEANEVAKLAFRLGIGFFFLCLACMMYLMIIEGKEMALLLAFVALAGEIAIMNATLGRARKISTDAERNDAEAVRAGSIKGKKQGYAFFCAFLVLAVALTLFVSDLI